jgi:hypothetical protein
VDQLVPPGVRNQHLVAGRFLVSGGAEWRWCRWRTEASDQNISDASAPDGPFMRSASVCT